MRIFKPLLVPAITALCFVIISASAIFMKVYLTEGVSPSLSEIFSTSPICYFWILWFVLIFFCTNGICKEYRMLASIARNEYPLLSELQINKITRIEIGYEHSKKLLLLFIGLPLCVEITFFDSNMFQASLTSIFILLIPFFIDLIIFIMLGIKRDGSDFSLK